MKIIKALFYKDKTEIKGYPAFTIPKDQKKFSIHLSQKEKKELIDSIHKSRIESGLFWLENFLLYKIKNARQSMKN